MLDRYHIDAHSLQESSKGRQHPIRQKTHSSTSRRAPSNGVILFFVAQPIIKITFFRHQECKLWGTTHRSSAISGIAFNVSCLRAISFESQLTLNSDESVQQFRERQRMHSFFREMVLDCPECVGQLKESIPRRSFEER